MNNTLLSTLLYNQKIKKIANFFLNQKFLYHNTLYKLFLEKRIDQVIQKYQQAPFSLRIENTNFCNGQCYMCPHPTMKRKKGVMSKDLYKKIIDEAKTLGVKYINLHNFGEPLADKEFIWKVKYAKSNNIEKVSTNTNGILLTEKLIKEIIESGLDELYFSVDAATKKTYQKIRIGLDYNCLKKNIKKIISYKKKYKLKVPKIILDFLEFNLNQHETEKFINKWQNQVDHVCISQLHDWSNKKKLEINKSINNFVEYSQSPCRLPFTEMLINWDGSVSLCCQDIEGEVILGNANDKTISEIWQNKKYQSIRQSHLKLKVNNLNLCSHCKLRTFWWTF